MRVHGERNNRLYPIDEEQFNFTPVAAFSGGFLRGIYAPRRTRHRFFKSHQHSWWFALGIKRVVCGAFFADLECPIARSRLLPCTGTSLGLFCTCPSVPARREQGGSPYVFRLPVHFFREERVGRRLWLRRPASPCARYRLDHFRNVGLDIPHLLQVSSAALVCPRSFTQTSRFLQKPTSKLAQVTTGTGALGSTLANSV